MPLDQAHIEAWWEEHQVCIICGHEPGYGSMLCRDHGEIWIAFGEIRGQSRKPGQFAKWVDTYDLAVCKANVRCFCAQCDQRFGADEPTYLCPSCQ